ncbi:MAG: hypothetical protein A3F72_08520 [Bacteroidetes bacterium RIFCSPLOWO2_12_FULL_35_15]|nr:MAG: hypothetical protein A3F72_08520 [Bacteroidetes bacterium RIFCSPLOWO2_12_FULL_35_15]
MGTKNLSAKPAATELPYEISEYLKENFREDFLTEIKKTTTNDGKVIYKVDVSNEDQLYHLKFNSKGLLMEKEMEPILELDIDEYGVVD